MMERRLNIQKISQSAFPSNDNDNDNNNNNNDNNNKLYNYYQ